eukprot:388852_1
MAIKAGKAQTNVSDLLMREIELLYSYQYNPITKSIEFNGKTFSFDIFPLPRNYLHRRETIKTQILSKLSAETIKQILSIKGCNDLMLCYGYVYKISYEEDKDKLFHLGAFGKFDKFIQTVKQLQPLDGLMLTTLIGCRIEIQSHCDFFELLFSLFLASYWIDISIVKKRYHLFEDYTVTNVLQFRGFLMVLYANTLCKWLKSKSILKLRKLMVTICVKKCNINYITFNSNKLLLVNNECLKICKVMKNWNVENIRKIGWKVITASNQINQSDNKIYTNDLVLYGYIAMSKHEFCKANSYFVAASVREYELYLKILYMKNLSDCCYLNGQYLISLKILKVMRKLCKGYILRSFRKKRKMVKSKLKKMKCFNCNKRYAKQSKFQTCKGCMVVLYCSKLCQKVHWKFEHRNNCNGSWIELYSMLKCAIFDCL